MENRKRASIEATVTRVLIMISGPLNSNRITARISIASPRDMLRIIPIAVEKPM